MHETADEGTRRVVAPRAPELGRQLKVAGFPAVDCRLKDGTAEKGVVAADSVR